MMNKTTFLLALFFSAVELQAQSYEGYIANIVYTLPVWVDLVIPASDGTVTGTYFYKQYGGSIILSGTKTGNNINLIEKDSKQKVTGIFACTNFGDSIIGIWRKKKDGDSLMVRLYKTDPAYKKFAKIPTADRLILSSGSTLDSELQYCRDSVEESSRKPTVMIAFAEKNILSTCFIWESMGAYPTSRRIDHTFDLTNNKEIVFSNEISDAKAISFNGKLCEEFQKQLTAQRKGFPDSVWLNVLSGTKSLDEYFNVSDCSQININTLFLTHNQLEGFIIESYFSLPHVNQSMDFDCYVEIPFTELVQYLKPTSILRNLAKTP